MRDSTSLSALEATLGALPGTISSTSRGQGQPARIHFFRVPAGLHFEPNPAPAIEVIQHTHRYAVVSPSIHPSTGAEYAWFGADGSPLDHLPSPAEYSVLPDAWVQYLKADPSTISSADPIASADLEALLSKADAGLIDARILDDLEGIDPVAGYDQSVKALYRLAYWFATKAGASGLGTALTQVLAQAREGFEKRHAGEPWAEREASLSDALARGIAKKREAYARPLTAEQQAFASARAASSGAAEAAAFWDARPVLAHLRDYAVAVDVSPWGLLGATIERALLSVPFGVHYVSYRGPVPVNILCAFVGSTGAGKTFLQRATADAFVWQGDPSLDPFTLDAVKPSSGEGLADSYRAWNSETKAVEWVEGHRQLFAYDEIAELTTGTGARQGATLFEVIKTAESGGSLSRVLSGGKRFGVAGGQYRFVMHMNVQPKLAGGLVSPDQVASGFPGRILWLPVLDPDSPDSTDSRPEPWTVAAAPWTETAILALPEMNEAHREVQRARKRHEKAPEAQPLDEMESHGSLLRAKVAIALAVMDGRHALDAEDWRLAGEVLDVSAATRTAVIDAVKAVRQRELFARGTAAGFISKVTAETQEKQGAAELAKQIKNWDAVGLPQSGKTGWRQKLNSRRREYIPAALELLADEGHTLRGAA